MAEARQKEMNVSITVVATKTLIAGRCRFGAVVDIIVPGYPGKCESREQWAVRIYQSTASQHWRWRWIDVGLLAVGGDKARKQGYPLVYCVKAKRVARFGHLFPLGQVCPADAIVPAKGIGVHQRPEQPHD